MKKKERFTMKEATERIISKIAIENEIPKTFARRLFIESLLSYKVEELILSEIDSMFIEE